MKRFREVREIFGALKHRSPSKIYCPRCGSPQIGLMSGFDNLIAPRKYLCQDCGYSGQIVMELEKEDGKD